MLHLVQPVLLDDHRLLAPIRRQDVNVGHLRIAEHDLERLALVALEGDRNARILESPVFQLGGLLRGLLALGTEDLIDQAGDGHAAGAHFARLLDGPGPGRLVLDEDPLRLGLVALDLDLGDLVGADGGEGVLHAGQDQSAGVLGFLAHVQGDAEDEQDAGENAKQDVGRFEVHGKAASPFS